MKPIYFLLLGICFLSLNGVVFAGTPGFRMIPQQSGPVIELVDQWQFRWEDTSSDSPGVPVDGGTWVPELELRARSGDANLLWARYELPGDLPEHTVMVLVHGMLKFEAFVDSTLIYRSRNLRSEGSIRLAIPQTPMFALGPDAGGRTLFFRIYADQQVPLGFIPPAFIGNEADILLYTFRKDLDALVVGLLILAAGLISLLLLLAGTGTRRSMMLLHLAIFSLCLGIYYVGSCLTTRIIVPTTFWYYFMAGLFLFPVGMLNVLEQVIEPRYRMVIRRLWQVHLAFAVVVLLLDTMGMTIYFAWSMIFFVLLTISLVVSAVTMAPAIKRRDMEARVFALGVVAMFGPALYDTVVLGFDLNPGGQGISHWGVLAFLGFVGYLPIHRLKETTRRLQEKSDELHEANTQLNEYAVTLEERVEERTRALQQALDHLTRAQGELVQAEKMASLGRLTAGIAHEIKNPLNFVNNFASLSTELAGELEDIVSKMGHTGVPNTELKLVLQDLKFNAERIKEHGQRADAIVQGMLLHARGLPQHTRSIRLNPLVDEYVKLAWHAARAQAPGFEIMVEREYDETVGEIFVAPQEIGRVVLNLLNNAFWAVTEKANNVSGSFQPRVLVRTRDREEHVEIRIQDNGTGIPEGLRQRIFEPFFTTKTTGQGAGLGLSLSYDIVVQGHGGALHLETEEGQYTTFIVELPKRPVHTLEESVETRS